MGVAFQVYQSRIVSPEGFTPFRRIKTVSKPLRVDKTGSARGISDLSRVALRAMTDVPFCYNGHFVAQCILTIVAVIRVFFRTRADTALEILALRQQVAVLKRKRPRPPLGSLDRLFWATLRHFWSRWSEVLVIVKPETGGRLAPCRFSLLLALALPFP
jgi:hypothetical protein